MTDAWNIEERDNEGLALASVMADGFVHGASQIEVDIDGWAWPRRFDEAQLRVLCSCMAWRPGAYRQLAQATAGVTLRLSTDATRIAFAVNVRQEPPVAQGLRARLGKSVEDADETLDDAQVSCVVDGRELGSQPVRDGMVGFSLADPQKEPGLGVVALPGLGERHEVSVWLPCTMACGIRELWADGTYVEPMPTQDCLLVLGDSSAQGIFSADPAATWPALLSRELGLGLTNMSVGLQVFQPTVASSLRVQDAAHVVVQLGGSYRAYVEQGLSMHAVGRDARTFLLELRRVCPMATLWVVTPFSRSVPEDATREDLAMEHVATIIRKCGREVGAHVLEGDELCDAEDVMVAGNADVLQPHGHALFAERLAAAMRKAERGGRKVSRV